MKTKYQRMKKDEKKECRRKYYETAKGKEMKFRFMRLNILGVAGLLFSAYLLLSGYWENNLSWGTWVIAIILILFSVMYIVGSYLIKQKCLNNFAVKNYK